MKQARQEVIFHLGAQPVLLPLEDTCCSFWPGVGDSQHNSHLCHHNQQWVVVLHGGILQLDETPLRCISNAISTLKYAQMCQKKARVSSPLLLRPTGRIRVAGIKFASAKRTLSLPAAGVAGVDDAAEVDAICCGTAAATAFPSDSLSESPARVKVESCSKI